MKLSFKRAEYAALTGLVVSLVFFLITLLLGNWSGSFVVWAVAWQILGGVVIWLVLTIQFHQRSLAEQEKLDMAQLAKGRDATTIFKTQDEQSGLFAVAQGRLALFEKWFLPIFAAIIGLYEVGIGAFLFKVYMPDADILVNQPLINAGFMAGIAFVCFLISRYAIGMSVENEWRPLRAGGSYLLAAAIVCFLSAVALTFAQFKYLVILKVLAWVVPILLGLLGIETIFNLVMDIYRPRLKGQYSRAAFESRLLGLIGEPGGILHTAASAVDYQFGFKVSQTWFFKLLERAIVPLVLFSIVTLYLLSCIVIVEPDEQGIVERFGRPMIEQRLEPGIHAKWPWPIDIAYKYPVNRILQVNVGFVPDEEDSRKPLLWNTAHFKQEYDLLTATRSASGYGEGAVPVSIIRAAIPVQYRVKNLAAFLYKHTDSEKMLEAICYREVVQFVASATIETETDEMAGGGSVSILGAGRAQAAQDLMLRIQRRADDDGLGVEIVFLGLQGFHPPPTVADDYENVIGSVQKKQAQILVAMAQRNGSLTMLAGSVEKADSLYDLARQYQSIKETGDAAAIDKAGKDLDAAFGKAQGDIFATLRKAKSDAFEKSTVARADSERFVGQLKAYRASKLIYKNEQKLSMLEEALEPIRKFVVAVDPTDAEVVIIDLQEKLTPSLYDITGVEGQKK
ncbi:MAG: SPFH domain-containing protein [Sedimentisphaerales bacterium]|nr:SPFH domain-containing protein [Sedimentisphaerales bacterium]